MYDRGPGGSARRQSGATAGRSGHKHDAVGCGQGSGTATVGRFCHGIAMKSLLYRLAPVLLSVAAVAQTPPCIANNDATTTVGTSITAFGFGGPGGLAYRFTPTTSLVLAAAKLFTGNVALTNQGAMTLEVWDENVVTGLPGTRLVGGTWQVQNSLGVGWQGASFDGLAPVNAGVNYWLVWREPGGSRLPYEAGGTTVPVARLVGGNWVLQAAQQPLKWRGFCSLPDEAGTVTLGFGCAASTGRIPSSFTNHAPTIGNANFQFEASGFAAGTLGLAVLGANPGWASFPIPGAPVGCEIHVEPVVVNVVPVGTGNQQAGHGVGTNGHCWQDLAIPANPSLVGAVVDAQFAGLDVGSVDPLPFVFTNGVRITLF